MEESIDVTNVKEEYEEETEDLEEELMSEVPKEESDELEWEEEEFVEAKKRTNTNAIHENCFRLILVNLIVGPI